VADVLTSAGVPSDLRVPFWTLVRDNIAPATRLLELQRQLEQTRGERDRGSVGIEQARSSLVELEAEVENARANYRLRAMDELNTVVAEQSELAESLPRLEERVSRTVIRAPMEGIVSRLNFRTPGGFVNTGDVMLELVPTGEACLMKVPAFVRNKSHRQAF